MHHTASILLPVYNGAAYLAPQIQSVLDQTYHDFELLIVDDGSTDASWDVISDFAAKDSRIACWRHLKNAGQEAALLALVEKSKADLVLFCDQDDIWHPAKVEVLMAALGRASLAYGPSVLIDANGSELGATLAQYVGASLSGQNRIRLLVGNFVSAHAMVIRRSLITPSAYAHSQARVLFDWRLAAAATFADGLAYVGEAVTYHRLHGGNRFNGNIQTWGKRQHRSHRQHLEALIDIPHYLAGHPAIRPEARTAFAAINRALADYSKRPAHWHIRSHALIDAVMTPLRTLSDDQDTLAIIERKVGRVARGWLHPAYWRGEHRARRRR
ncbi:MAG: glycosyltransferase [Hyphomicrobiaceae bacterium]